MAKALQRKGSSLETEEVSMTSIKPYGKNARKHPEENIALIMSSIKKFGLRKPLVVWRGQVIAGNGTYEALKRLNRKNVHIVRADHLTPEEAEEFSIVDNRSTDLSEFDYDTLLGFYKQRPHLIEESGFTKNEIMPLLMTTGGKDDPYAEWEGMPEYTHKDLNAWKQLIVSFANEQDYLRFAKLVGQKLTDKTRSIWYPKAEVVSELDKRYADEEESE